MSSFFGFSYRLPEGMAFDDISTAPNGGTDPRGQNFIIFMANSLGAGNRDVVDVLSDNRRAAGDPSAASWMRALHKWNATRPDVPRQGEVEKLTVGKQQFARLRFEQTRNDGVLTYQAAYAVGVRGYVVYFIFGSTDQTRLGSLEKSINSYSTTPALQCSAPVAGR